VISAVSDRRAMPERSVQTTLALLQQGAFPTAGIDLEHDTDRKGQERTDRQDMLRCATCHAPITSNSDRIQVNAKHQHVCANPHGYVFQIGCFAQAPGCVIVGEPTAYFSWFPGYAWQIAYCERCLTLLGWAFRSVETFFFGLILDQLIDSSHG
jgi:hypothetical protein